jgi:predicted ester cyclase
VQTLRGNALPDRPAPRAEQRSYLLQGVQVTQQVDARFASDFLERLHAAVNALDAARVAALCCEDVVWDDPAAPEPLQGRRAVYHFHREIIFQAIPDVRIERIGTAFLALDGFGVAVRLRISGTMTGSLTPLDLAPTGRAIEFETAEFSQFEGGLLARHTVVLNMLALARQIGAVSQAGSLGERIGVWMQHVAAHWTRSQE